MEPKIKKHEEMNLDIKHIILQARYTYKTTSTRHIRNATNTQT